MYYIHDKSIYPCGKCGSPGVVIAHDLSTREGIDIGIGDVVCSNRKCKMHFGRNLPASTHYSGKYRTTKKAAIAIWNMINTDIRDMYPQMTKYEEPVPTDPDEYLKREV